DESAGTAPRNQLCLMRSKAEFVVYYDKIMEIELDGLSGPVCSSRLRNAIIISLHPNRLHTMHGHPIPLKAKSRIMLFAARWNKSEGRRVIFSKLNRARSKRPTDLFGTCQ